MSSLKLNNKILLDQVRLDKTDERKAKLVINAPSFIAGLPDDVKTIVTAKKAFQLILSSDGCCYLGRYLAADERKKIHECLNTKKGLPSTFIPESLVRDFGNVLNYGAVPLVRVSIEGYIFMCNILNTFFNQVEDLVQNGNIADSIYHIYLNV